MISRQVLRLLHSNEQLETPQDLRTNHLVDAVEGASEEQIGRELERLIDAGYVTAVEFKSFGTPYGYGALRLTERGMLEATV